MVSSVTTPTQNVYLPKMPKPDSVKEFPTYYEYNYKTEAGSDKKWGVGIASAILPGLGQAINGQWGKGFAFLCGNLAATLAMGLSASKTVLTHPRKAGVGMLLAVLAPLGVNIWSIVDAVKNAKETTKQIVPKGNDSINMQA